jgi:hypothetical protein
MRDYYEYPEKYINNKRNRINELKQFVTKLKSEKGCQRCDEEFPPCLHYHHTRPEEKEYGIAEMVKGGFSKTRILEEMEKCLLLCANCHIKEHHQ